MRRQRLMMAGAVLGLLMTGGCRRDYRTVDIYVVDGGTDVEGVAAGELALEDGGVLVIEVHPVADGARPYTGMERLKLFSDDSRIATIARTIWADTWIIAGDAVGTARINVEIDGRLEDSFEVEIVPQPGEED